MADLMASVEETILKKNVPMLHPGDTVRVHAKVVEGNRERIQVFDGVVMRLRRGGARANFTVRRVSHGVGVERTFLLNSPRVEKIEVMRHGHVRRAQLYYLRGRVGRAARIREKKLVAKGLAAAAPAEVAEEPAVQPEQESAETTPETQG